MINTENPFFNSFQTVFEVPPFHILKEAHFIPALHEAVDIARNEIQQIAVQKDQPTFFNTIEKLESSGELISKVSSVLFNLNEAETTDGLQKITQQASQLLTAFDTEVKQNEPLFARIRHIFENEDRNRLTAEQAMLLDKTWKSFVRSGAGLSLEEKTRFKEISLELAQLTLKFGENVLAETNNFQLIIDLEGDLAGLPADLKARAAALANEQGMEDHWIFTLQAPSYIPFMEYAENRILREKLFRAYMQKGIKGNEFDNRENVKRIVFLRAEKAKLLGYKTYADFVLEERMAQKPVTVHQFLDDLLERALPKAKIEVDEIKQYMNRVGATHDLARWDWAYYSEKLRKEKFDLDDELIKPYFKLEYVIEGVFKSAEKLFGISFIENKDIPVYHQDVMAYEVIEGNTTKAVFMADFFPRKGKRPGAWMTSFRDQKMVDGNRKIPIVSIVCNFTPSTEGQPSLLKFEEVLTLFHEFGHALHGMMANTNYGSLSGTSVYWDFVELPSQIFENWCYEKECLDLFARHYVTNEPIPQLYINRIKTASTYHEAFATVRQISFGLLDLSFHHKTLEELHLIDEIENHEKKIMNRTDLFPQVANTCMSTQFSHIFAGGYGAGYYSYKWAEVLDADAFELFKEKGVFDTLTANSFKENILSKGGTENPMDLYIKFRGRKPKPDALLKRAGLV